MGTAFLYFGSLVIGWVLLGIGIWLLSRQMQRYNPPIPALFWLIGIILAAHLISLTKVTFVPGKPSLFISSGDAWERGWPYRWYGIGSIAIIAAPYYLLFNTVWWTITLGGWSYLTIRFLPNTYNRRFERLWVFGSISLALIAAYSLPFLFPKGFIPS
jgi:hypothetical protein